MVENFKMPALSYDTIYTKVCVPTTKKNVNEITTWICVFLFNTFNDLYLHYDFYMKRIL